jgi:peptidoglycan/LPS O-acetylase OafA/YrhL
LTPTDTTSAQSINRAGPTASSRYRNTKRTYTPLASASKRVVRTDIQALRALAVCLVVLNHLWPARLPGGYVGVDVFFVISGFLITSHLSKELFASGRVQLGQFYARRARRLLPAAFAVLVVSLVGAWLWLPYTRWTANAQEIVGSAFYVENWVLAAKAVDYSTMNSSASMVQHYWSLSVEEQFYLVWPLALMGLYSLAVGRNWAKDQVLRGGLVGVTVLSFCFSVYLTAASSSEAYFNTPVRVWEFGAGALLALSVTPPVLTLVLRNVLSVLGFSMVLISAVSYDHATPFPGWTALAPVAGTALVILAGNDGSRLWHDGLTALRPVQFLGNISYSLYLWHWPLIVVAPFVLGETVGTPVKVCLALSSVVLAWLTKRWIEDRWIVRSRRPSRPGRVLVGVAAGMLVVLLGGLTLHLQVAPKASAAAELARTDSEGPCFGPRAVGKLECGDPFARPVIDPHMGPANEYWTMPPECSGTKDTLGETNPAGPAICDFSGGRKDVETVWLVGDSHAQQWQPALVKIASHMNWRLKVSYSGGCPLADVRYVGYRGKLADPAAVEKCRRWSNNVAEAVERDRPARVFTSSFAAGENIEDGSGRSQLEQYKAGFVSYWSRWTAAGARVYPIADPPLNDRVRDIACIPLSAGEPTACRAPRSEALPADPIVAASELVSDGSVRLIDMSQYFCDNAYCYGAVGGVSVYFDLDHLNAQLTSVFWPEIMKEADIGR